MNTEELVSLVRQRIKEEGGIYRFAENHDLCPGYLTNVLYCGQKPGPKIALAVGMKKVYRFEPIK